jgi:hypothetical protein
MTLTSSLLLNIKPCHLFCMCDILFNVYDPPIETNLMVVSWAQLPSLSRQLFGMMIMSPSMPRFIDIISQIALQHLNLAFVIIMTI